MGSRLVDALATTEELTEVFSDGSILQAMLDVEVALARVQARLGLIPSAAAEAIAAAADHVSFDQDAIARSVPASATPVIPFVKALTERTRTLDEAAARFVHWGATSQDIADTAFNLCLRRAHRVLEAGYTILADTLVRLSDAHADTVMLGRTLLQPAPPVTFGLKVAGWYAASARGWRRIAGSCREALVLQFGGAVGTLAALGDAGPEVARGLALDLGLGEAGPSWHAHRDRLAALVAAHGLYVATLGKIARDIALLMQVEVHEAAEPGGRSSTMPHKRNPAACATAIAAAIRTPGLVATMLGAMAQEHERGVGGWQAEWPTIAAIVKATGAAQRALTHALTGLSIDPARMRANLDAMNGLVCGERIMMRLGGTLGRDVAHTLVSRAIDESQRTGLPFVEALAGVPEISAHIPLEELREMVRPETYLGSAETIRRRLLDESAF